MTGVLNAVVGAHSFSRHIVTLGVLEPPPPAFDLTGFAHPSGSNFGSVSPGTVRGVTIQNIYSRTSQDLQFWLQGEYTQSYFSRIVIEDGGGVVRTYHASSADLFQNQGSTYTVWGWGTGSNVVWAPSDVSEQRFVHIVF